MRSGRTAAFGYRFVGPILASLGAALPAAGHEPPPAPASIVPPAAAEAPVDAPSAAPADPQVPPSTSSIHFNWTNFAGAAVSGPGEDEIRLGGRIDLLLAVDGRDLGLWEGLTIRAHPEFAYGRNVNDTGYGGLFPVNVAMNFPTGNDEDFDLSFYLSQRIGGATLNVGKINMLDLAAATPLVGGGGQEGFQHTVLATPPSGITPPTVFGGLLTVPLGGSSLTLGIWDPASAINRTGFEDMFDTGVAGMASLAVPLPIGGRPGIHTFSVQATSIRGLNLADIPDLFLPPESEAVLGERQGGFQLKYSLIQYVWTDPADPRRGWGLFGQVAVWEDNPLPFDWMAHVGLTGSVPIASRPDDRFGLGYFRIGLSPALREGLAFLLDIGDEQGAEIFYTFQAGPHARLTFNAQWVDPFVQALGSSWFLGSRLRFAF